MKPIKAKDLIIPTALENNLSVDVTEEIIKTYWKDVKNALSDLKSPRIHISNLGDFVLKHWTIEDQKQKMLNILEYIKDNPKKINVIEQYNIKYNLICNVEQQYLEELQRKDFIKSHKKSLRNVKSNIQKQKTDIRRNKK